MFSGCLWTTRASSAAWEKRSVLKSASARLKRIAGLSLSTASAFRYCSMASSWRPSRTEVWRNVTPGSNHWLRVSAVGTRSARDAIGTEIAVTTASGTQHNHVTTSVGYGCASEPQVHFGLGKDAVVQKMEVTWPSGVVQTFEDVAADQVFAISEPEG